jgi:uncharacterized membrane protein|tara:strand:- start:258 stop:446 length:189 start_codon:yes stop_codon:yes gene_type:complete
MKKFFKIVGILFSLLLVFSGVGNMMSGGIAYSSGWDMQVFGIISVVIGIILFFYLVSKKSKP